MTRPDTGRVVVGMSGGVDSSVAALLLCEQGYEVHGLFMRNWEEEDDDYCNAAEDFQEARQVCEHLGIPLHKISFAREYRDRVFAHFLSEYRNGRTPNPDVLCNREIKFGVFLDYARRLGAQRIATGHYARIGSRHGRAQLMKGVDENKDQSYFLHAVPHAALEQTLFPLGDLTKDRVRAMARAGGLPNFARKDSTGICFIGERPFREFLSRYLPAQPGEMRTIDGEVVGRHHGLMYYTLGQRQGLGIGGRRGSSGAPWYVVAKNLDSNVLVVALGRDHGLLTSIGLSTGRMSWVAGEPPSLPMRCTARVRYRQREQVCVVEARAGDRVAMRFDEPQWAVTPGQYAVLYLGEVCLGGAVIESTESLDDGTPTGDAGPARAAGSAC